MSKLAAAIRLGYARTRTFFWGRRVHGECLVDGCSFDVLRAAHPTLQ